MIHLRNDHDQLRADVTGFMNNPTGGINASNLRNTNTQSLGISQVESGNHDNIGNVHGNGNTRVTVTMDVTNIVMIATFNLRNA